MCSIIGYVGGDAAAPILVGSLRRMEYRGYDSVGVATCPDGSISLRKGTGRVGAVNEQVGLDRLPGSIGLGHTRWATHGSVTDVNAHPHLSSRGGVAIVHNGIIENHAEMRSMLEGAGYKFASQTDSEVIANLLQYYYDETGSVRKSLLMSLKELRGHYAFIAMFGDGTLASARYGEPLIVGVAQDALFLSSDVLGFIEHTDEAIYLESGTCCIIRDGRLHMMDYSGNATKWRTTTVSKEFGDARLDEYTHYTLKEINEQPEVARRAGAASRQQLARVAELIRAAGYAYATGSGTSYHAALMGRRVLARFAGVRLEVILSSEMSSERDILQPGKVMLAISQSGESADVLEAAGAARQAGCVIVAVVNSANSQLAKMADVTLLLECGPEIGVAATKSFCAQYSILLRLADALADDTGIDHDTISGTISDVISGSDAIKAVAQTIHDATDIYVLGRGLHYPVAIEAALKIKELTYIHAEGLPGGEMKHGPLALIDGSSVVLVMNPYDSTYGDMLLGAQEAKSRGGIIIGVSDRNSDIYDHWLEIPDGNELTYSFAETVTAQLLSYYVALARHTNPDYPRNLAKSVTVK